MLIVDTEIKLIVMSLIARATPTLLEGKFEVADPLNTVRSLLPIFLLANLHARTSSRARHTGDPATKGHPCFRAPLEAVSPGLATASRHSHGPPEPLRSTAKPALSTVSNLSYRRVRHLGRRLGVCNRSRPRLPVLAADFSWPTFSRFFFLPVRCNCFYTLSSVRPLEPLEPRCISIRCPMSPACLY